ncbi:MAG TPA: HEPN domain-containing protein [Candidatus Bilamarchaeaceae archaeon]|nr:HEPN domain-containing protein [Candidatus Bilamarchaeaceae archaeon]
MEKSSSAARNMASLAERDLKAAADSLSSGNFDWVYAISYNAMLQAGRGLMFFRGFRPKGNQGHISVVKFVASEIPLESYSLASIFDRMRMKRHKVLYEHMDVVTREEAERALENARKFVGKIKSMLR